MLKTDISQKGKTVALFVMLVFAIAGLTAVTSLSNSSVAAQGTVNLSNPSVEAETQDSDPNDCFRTNNNIDTCPMHSHFKGLSNSTTDCFKIVGEGKVSTGDAQNYTNSVQSFFS